MSSSTPTPPTAPDRRRARRARLGLVGLFALFFIPILVAYVLNLFAPNWAPFGSSNRGQLIEPARLLPGDALRPLDGASPLALGAGETWTLLTVSRDGCGEPCLRALYRMRQTRAALGKDQDRITRVVLIPDDAERTNAVDILERYPGTRILAAAPAWLSVAIPGEPRMQVGALYLVDPQGYLILRYAAESAEDAALKDLKRLLRISKIG